MSYVFREAHYATIKASLKNDIIHDICVDFGNSIIMIDKKFIKFNVPDLKIQFMKHPVFIKEIRNKLININEYVLINVYLFNIIKSIIAIVIMKIHLINKLSVKMLINTDVISLEKIKLDLHSDKMTIDNCKNLVIKINNKTRINSNIERII